MKKVATTESVSAETGTGRHVIMMHFGNGDEVNDGGYLAVVWSAVSAVARMTAAGCIASCDVRLSKRSLSFTRRQH